MGFYKDGLANTAALCVGTVAVAFGAPPSGAVEAGVGLAGLAGFILGRSQKFGPECKRVRARIQRQIRQDFKDFIQVEGSNLHLGDELEAADIALQDNLEDSYLDRTKLAESAVASKGFADGAAALIMESLGQKCPNLFGAGKQGTLPYRYAQQIVQAGLKEAVGNADYYRQLEPKLMFEMAHAVGEVRDDVKQIKLTVAEIRDTYSRELEQVRKDLHANETELVSLLAFILQQRVSRQNLVSDIERSYQRLTELRDGMGDLRALANEAPEIMPLLEQADAALSAGAGFSLDDAECALAKADQRYLELIDEREEQVQRDKENRAKLLGKRARIAAVKFDYAAADDFYRQQLSLLIEGHGEEHPDTAASYNNVASNLDDQGRFAEAEPLYRKAMKIWQSVLGEAHPDTATSYNNLAYNLNAQGRFAEAELLYRKAMKILESVLGEAHPDTATSYNNLASNLNAQGRFQEAEPLYRKAMKIRQSVLGEAHPDTATSYNNVAAKLDDQGRFAEAEPLYRKAMIIRQRALGEAHPDTALSYNNVAYNLNAQGRFEEAEPLYRKAMKIWESVLGEAHPDTALSYNNVAHNLNAQDRFEEAEPLYRKAMKIRQRVLGEAHPDTATSYNNLASNQYAQGRFKEAEVLYRKALEIMERVLGKDHPNTVTVRENLMILTSRTR